jgi:Leucine-rich repeat (LRR) protein
LIFLDLYANQLSSIPLALRNAKSLERLDLGFNNIGSISSNAFGNNPSLKELHLDELRKLNLIADCSFCGLTSLEICSLNDNENLKQINENAFGFLKNSVDRPQNINRIEIHDGGLKTVPHKLLPWDKIQISILGNPANCDARMDWLFRNKAYDIDMSPTLRYYDSTWCKYLFKVDFCLYF